MNIDQQDKQNELEQEVDDLTERVSGMVDRLNNYKKTTLESHETVSHVQRCLEEYNVKLDPENFARYLPLTILLIALRKEIEGQLDFEEVKYER